MQAYLTDKLKHTGFVPAGDSKQAVSDLATADGLATAVGRLRLRTDDTPPPQKLPSEIDGMFSIRKRALRVLKNRELSTEKLDSLTNLLGKLNHDIELLSGRETERTGINIELVRYCPLPPIKEEVITPLIESENKKIDEN